VALGGGNAGPYRAGFHDHEDLWLPGQPKPFVIMDMTALS